MFVIIRQNQGGYREFGGLMGNYPSFMSQVKMMASERCASWKCIITNKKANLKGCKEVSLVLGDLKLK